MNYAYGLAGWRGYLEADTRLKGDVSLVDIPALCKAGLITHDACWWLWQQRQSLAGSDGDQVRAQLAVVTHLARIEQHRPLHEIANAQAHTAAQEVRHWFRYAFLGSLATDE